MRRYFVVPAPGYYGDEAEVRSSHSTVTAARKAAGQTGCVRVGYKRKGELWLRIWEEQYPIAQ